MSPSYEPAGSLKTPPKRPTSIVPVVPLAFSQKRKHHQGASTGAGGGPTGFEKIKENAIGASQITNSISSEEEKIMPEKSSETSRILPQSRNISQASTEKEPKSPDSVLTKPLQPDRGLSTLLVNGDQEHYKMPPAFVPSAREMISSSPASIDPSPSSPYEGMPPPQRSQSNGRVTFENDLGSTASSSNPSSMTGSIPPYYNRRLPSPRIRPDSRDSHYSRGTPSSDRLPPFSHAQYHLSHLDSSIPKILHTSHQIRTPNDCQVEQGRIEAPIHSLMEQSWQSTPQQHRTASSIGSSGPSTTDGSKRASNPGAYHTAAAPLPSFGNGHAAGDSYDMRRLNLADRAESANRTQDLYSTQSAASDLQQWILSQFGTPLFADHSINLRHVRGRFAPVHVPVHALLISRSPGLRSLLDMLRSSHGGKDLMIDTEDKYLTGEAFISALGYLYGAPLLEIDTIPDVPDTHAQRGNDTEGTNDSSKKMKFALAYIAAGHLLQLSIVAQRGAEVAMGLIDWSTVEQVLAFAMMGGLGPEWQISPPPSTAVSSRAASRRPSLAGEHRSHPSGSSTSTLTSPLETNMSGSTLETNSTNPYYQISSPQLLHASLSFLVQNFPPSFGLDITSSALPLHILLPSVPDHHGRALSASLSAIRFGDYPVDDPPPTQSSQATTALSQILLSLPYPLLKTILENPQLGSLSGWIDPSHRQRVARDVIDERERRRIAVLRSIGVSHTARREQSRAWEVVGWAENAITTFGGEDGACAVEITRRWKGFRNPLEKNVRLGGR